MTRSSRTYSCPICGRLFYRSDSLKRHGRIHDKNHRRRKDRRRACQACASSRTRCSEETPTCERCVLKGLSCIYSTDKSWPQLLDSSINGSDDGTIGQVNEASVAWPPLGLGDKGDGPTPETTVNGATRTGSSTFTPTQDDHGVLEGSQDTPRNSAGYQGLMPDFVMAESQAGPSWSQTALSQFIGVGDFYPSLLSPFASDWASVNSFANVFDTPLPQNVSLPRATFGDAPSSPLDTTLSLSAIETTAGISRPQTTNSSISYQLPLTDSCQYSQNRAQDSPSGAGARQCQNSPDSLPELFGRLEPSDMAYAIRFSLPSVNAATHARLQDCLRLPLSQSPWLPTSMPSFPTGPQIDYFIDLYFSHFDILLPMIHRPTFEPGAHPVLTLAMCAIGVLYSGFENKRSFSKSLCELLRRLFLTTIERSPGIGRNYDFLAAQTLHSVLSNSSSGRRLFDFGDSNRSLIVANARAAGLFTSRNAKYEAEESEGSSTRSQWLSWIRTERMRRLAWCIYISDASATYYRNIRAHVPLSEMNTELPSSMSHWEAASPQAWANLHPWANGATPRNASLRGTLRQLCEFTKGNQEQHVSDHTKEKILSSVQDEFHRVIISTTLLRTLWDYREVTLEMQAPVSLPSSLMLSVPPDATSNALSLLGALTTTALQTVSERSLASGDTEISRADTKSCREAVLSQERAFQGQVHRARIFLVAQIIAADQISNHLDAEWQRGTSHSGGRPSQNIAEERLRKWGSLHPVQTRRMARVGAQLLAISRLYPYHMPRESYDAFRAGLLLWTMVPLITAATFTLDKDVGVQRGQRRVCQLDWLGDEDAPEAQVIRDWIENGGGQFVLRIHGIADICTTEGSRRILQSTADVLQGLHVWGASKTYRNIVLCALQGDAREGPA